MACLAVVENEKETNRKAELVVRVLTKVVRLLHQLLAKLLLGLLIGLPIRPLVKLLNKNQLQSKSNSVRP